MARGQSGFTYIGLLLLVALLAAGLGVVGRMWHTDALREKEKELLFIGNEFKRAIEQYHAANNGRNERLPKSLESLLLDENQPAVKRYLRRIYADPLTGKAEWGLMKQPNGGIIGVYSLATGMPLKRVNFPAGAEGFENANSYAEWMFVAAPATDAVPQPAANAALPSAIAPVAAPEPAPVPAPEPATPPKPRLRRLCEIVANNDAIACQQQQARWGNATDCYQSARERLAACQAGETLPALSIRHL